MTTTVYIGHLSSSTTSADVENAFSQHGLHPSKVTIMQDRDTGKSREFGFVTFNNPHEAQQAINQMNETQIGGSHVKVNFANARPSGNSSAEFHSYLGESHISYPVDQYSGYGSGYGSSGGGYGGNQYGGYY